MSRKARCTILSVMVSAPITPFVYWCFGFNFDQRGVEAGYCCLITIAVVGFAAFCALTYEYGE